MRTDTAYGHARPPHPCRFAVLVHAGGCCFLDVFGAGQWPCMPAPVELPRIVPVCTVETAQRRAHWARPCASGFVRVFWHMCVAVCAGWGALRGTGVDAHAVRAHALRACVLDCADCPGSSGTHSGPVRACFLGTCAWLCVLGGGLCVALASTRMLCFFCVPCSSGTHCCPWWLFCRPRGWFYGRDATVAMQR